MTDDIVQSDETDSRAAGTTVELWVRRPVCGPRTTVIDRLGNLRASGLLEDFSVTTWPEEIVLTGRNRQEELLETIEGFEQWAADHGLSLRPPFETRTASLLVGGSEDVMTTPMMLATVFEEGELVGIYPCTDGTETYTISALLDELEAGLEGPPPGLGEQSTRATTEQGTT